MKEKVYVFLSDGFEEIEALTAIDVLRRAELDVEVVSITGQEKITGAHNVPIISDSLFRDGAYEDAALLLLPGGMPNAGTLSEHQGLKDLVKSFVQAERYVAAICAAPIVLGKQGLLKGRKATCYPGFESLLEGAILTDQQVVQDGRIITANGPGAAMNFALAVVELLCGADKVVELKKAMIVQ